MTGVFKSGRGRQRRERQKDGSLLEKRVTYQGMQAAFRS